MVKTMYDELILKLREDAEFLEISSKYNNTKNEFAERISQAADAIEKLSMRIHGDEAAIAGMKREIERMVVADKPRWIPVTERLPEEYKNVLCYYEYVYDTNAFLSSIDDAPTIIQAEESDMDSFIHIFEEDDEEDGMDSFIRILKD